MIYRTEYRTTLEHYRDKLQKAEERLCSDEGSLNVGFRDFDSRFATGKGAWNVHDMETLEERLRGPLTQSSKELEEDRIQPKDPQCRFVFLWADDSRVRLKVSFSALLKILTFHQVNPGYLEFIISFGKQRDGRGISFSRFRTHYYLKEGEAANSPSLTPEKIKDGDNSAGLQNTPAKLGLGRSGRYFQLSWSLKTVVKRAPAIGAPLEWSTRSVGLYHQFDIKNGRTLWITTSGREDIQLRV